MTEYRETGYGSDGYPHDSDDPRRGAAAGSPGTAGTYPGAAAYPGAGSVWRPTRGPRAGEAAGSADPGYGAPGRGWRTADGGYKSTEGGWRAPYRPYDTGEWHRDQGLDSGPTNIGDAADYSSGSGEIVRYRSGQGGEYRGGRGQRSHYPDSTDEIEPYRGGAPRYPGTAADGAPGPWRGEPERYPGGRNTGQFDRQTGAPGPRSTGEFARYSVMPGPPAPQTPQPPQYPAEDGAWRGYTTDGTGRGYTTDGRGRGYTTDGGGRGYTTDGGGWVARPGRAGADPGGGDRMAADPGEVRQYASDTADTTRIPRQTSSAGHPAAPPRSREDAPELYTHDPLTLSGGESPAMRYDPATDSYHGQLAEPLAPPSGVPGPRRSPGGDPRAREAGVYGRPPRQPGWAPPAGNQPAGNQPAGGHTAGGRDISARQSADRRYQEGPVRRSPGRPQQRFEGTYPARAARNPRNIPPRGRPVEDEPDEAPGYFHTALVTTAWYTIPLLLYTMYVLTLDGSASAGDGQSARENALNGLLGGMPRVAVALVTSLGVALLIRTITSGWRAATIGFASAVVGAGAATVIFAAMQ